jgi:hypothetical protein
VVLDGRGAPLELEAGRPLEVNLEQLGARPGAMLLRAFVVRPWGESVKSDQAFVARRFFYQKQEQTPLYGPLLTYNVPLPRVVVPARANRFLLDFVVSEVALAPLGHRVRYRIDEGEPVTLSHWAPIWIEGLAPGNHAVELELLDRASRIVAAPNNPVKREFELVLEAEQSNHK